MTRNYERTLGVIDESDAPVCMGHLEFNGFEAHPGHVMEERDGSYLFKKFKKVFSGHYHMKSKRDNVTILAILINYIGMTTNVREDFMSSIQKHSRQLSIEILLLLFISCIIMVEVALPDPKELDGTFVKLIVEDKGDYSKFDYTVTNFKTMGLADLKLLKI